ncbi:MAG: hypothetical protein MJE77_08075 [Proteobacteria bacterium]|nr:hypothetical protein [Pseudomonadota bacterium]
MRISALERGAVLAALLRAGDRGPEILARMAGSRGPRCAEVAARIQTASRDQRGRAIRVLVIGAQSPAPPGIERIHPEWIERALDGAGELVRRHVLRAAGHGPAGPGGEGDRHGLDPAIRAWLIRRITAEFVAMPTGQVPAGELAVTDLPVLPAGVVVEALHRFGRLQLAWALCRTEPARLAGVAAALGEPDGAAVILRAGQFLRGNSALRSMPAMGPARAVFRRFADLAIGADRSALIRAGSRALAARVDAAGGDLARQIAQRTAPRHGLIVLAELTGRYREEPLGDLPSWDAFVQCIGEIAGERV